MMERGAATQVRSTELWTPLLAAILLLELVPGASPQGLGMAQAEGLRRQAEKLRQGRSFEAALKMFEKVRAQAGSFAGTCRPQTLRPASVSVMHRCSTWTRPMPRRTGELAEFCSNTHSRKMRCHCCARPRSLRDRWAPSSALRPRKGVSCSQACRVTHEMLRLV
jgi:hypothetical protein